MITISVKNLLSAIDNADTFKLPDMTAGAEYIYNSLYMKLLRGGELRLSEINFNRFELDDVNTIRDMCSEIFGKNENKADSLARTLRDISPVTAASSFV